MLDLRSEITREVLDCATSDQLQCIIEECLNLYDEPEKEFSDLDRSLFQHIIHSIERDDEGRLIAPALWDSEVEHLLSKNFLLARKILKSTFRKLEKIKMHYISMMKLSMSNCKRV